MTSLSKIPAKVALSFCTLFCLYSPVVFSQQVDTAWVRRYNGPGNGDDQAVAIAVDSSGNVYVTGSCVDSTGYYDYCTIKYLPNGDTGWVRRYNGPDNLDDFAVKLVLDDSGYVYVTGTSSENYLNGGCGGPYLSSYATIKYTLDGDTVWVRRTNRGFNGLHCDSATDLAVDKNGVVYVIGMSSEYCGLDNPVNKYRLVRYASNGDTIRTNGFNARLCDAPRAFVAIDKSGEFYLTSGSTDSASDYVARSSRGWVQQYDGPTHGTDFPRAITVDDQANTYVTGVSEGDILTSKYDSLGSQLWVGRFVSYWVKVDYTGGFALAVDKNGNVLVTGSAWDVETPVAFTVKYDSMGNQLWYQRMLASDHGSAIVVDTNDNAYVASIAAFNFVTKYDPSSNIIWAKSYSATPEDIAIDLKENVYAAGYCYHAGTGLDFITIKYSPLPQLKGDLDLDGILGPTDVVLALNCVFAGEPPPAACNINCDGEIGPSDVVFLLLMVFSGAPAPC